MIKAIFTDDVNTVSVSGLTQWDYGRKLHIVGLTLPDVAEVHFASSSLYAEAITRFTKPDTETDGYVVDIPNEVLREPYDIKAWLYLIDDEHGETLKTILLPLTKRTRPKDFVNPPDPAEETLLNEMIAHFNSTADQMREDQENFKTTITADQEEFKEDVAQLIAEMGQIAPIKNVTIQTTAFVASSDFEQYPYHADITIENLKATDICFVNPSPASKAQGCLVSHNQSFEGYLRQYAKTQPSENIVLDWILIDRRES